MANYLQLIFSMMQTPHAAFGIFYDKSQISAAKRLLFNLGFSEVFVKLPQTDGAQDFEHCRTTQVKKGALVGGGVGMVIVLVALFLVKTQIVIMPFFPHAESTGTQILVTLVSLFFGLILGVASGALVGIGTPARAFDRLRTYVEVGGILLAVHVKDSDEGELAVSTLRQAGAQDVTILPEFKAWAPRLFI